MFRTTLLAIALALAAVCSAAPLSTAPPFEISQLSMERVTGGNVTMQFTVFDPDPLTNATDSCSAEWVFGSRGFPSGPYKPCGSGNSTFAWHLENFTNLRSFTLGIEHSFEDPAIGDPPYDWVTNFGRITINEDISPCTTEGTKMTCKQKSSIIKAPIYATAARR